MMASTEPPDLVVLLGACRPWWDALRAFLDELRGVTCAWNHCGAKHGAQLKATANKRALVYLIPRAGCFTAAVALRDPAIAALRATKFPAPRLRDIERARASPEGRPARVVVTGPRELAWAKQLVLVELQAG